MIQHISKKISLCRRKRNIKKTRTQKIIFIKKPYFLYVRVKCYCGKKNDSVFISQTSLFFLYMHMRLMPCNRPYGIVWSYPDLGKKEVSAMILSQLAPYISGYFPSITPNSLFLGEDAVDNNSSSVRRKGDTMDDFYF